MSHWMTEMMVVLVGKKEILASASFGGFQFWTETWGRYLVQIKEEFGADLQDLRVW